MLPKVTKDDATDSPVNESLVLRGIVAMLESNMQHVHSIEAIAAEFGIKRRGLYDFLSICTAFGICHRGLNTDFEWLGLDQSKTAIDELRIQIQSEGRQIAIQSFFNGTTELSLPSIANAMVKLFFYLSVKSLDLRKVAKFFSQGPSKYKTMIRKLYTVASALELAKIVRKTCVVSEIRLNEPIQALETSALPGLGFLLNTPNEVEDEKRYAQRRKQFDELCMGKEGQSECRTRLPSPQPFIGGNPWRNMIFT
jgi:hypothetical protein